MFRTDADLRRTPTKPLALLVLFSLSVVLTAATNRAVGRLLHASVPAIDWVATAAIPSMMLIAALYAVVGDRRPLSWPTWPTLAQRPVAGLSAAWLLLWLGGCAVTAVLTGHWLIYAQGWPLLLAFLVFGPLGEELLFRGLVFGYARDTWPSSASAAIMISTAAFSLHHIALQTAPHGLAVAQVLFTIPMGVVFALLRERTGSLWPGLLLHLATNLPSAI
jgi:membrane protease YdiL (CAAX protease family)